MKVGHLEPSLMNSSHTEHHPVFFYSDGTHFFQAHDGQYMFKVHESILAETSEMFRDMFRAHHDTGAIATDGQTEISPIRLPETISEPASELFLCVCYGKWRPDPQVPNEVVFQLLELGKLFASDSACEKAINEIYDRRTSIRPCRLISLSVKYRSEKLFTYACRQLVRASLNDLNDDEYTMLCPQLWAAILKAQNTLRTHRRIVACESPPINHAAGCPDAEICSLDWHQLWWNSMGRSLLDGRNPQSYKEAVRRFEQVLLTNKIGRMYPACLRLGMATVHGGAAFNQEDEFIDRAVRKWADKLLV